MYHLHSKMVHGVQVYKGDVSMLLHTVEASRINLSRHASQLITTLLKDVMVHCIACKLDLKAEEEKSVQLSLVCN